MGEMHDFAESANGEAYWGYDDEALCGPAGVGCRYCLAGPLYWFETDKGWRLFSDAGKLHECTKYKHEKGEIWQRLYGKR